MRRGLLVMAGVAALGLLAWLLCFAHKPTERAALAKKWHEQVYSLDESETIRFVPPPYTPLRDQKFILGAEKHLGLQAHGENKMYAIDRSYWATIQKPWWYHRSRFENPRPTGDVKAALEFAALGLSPDVTVPEELRGVAADGDWIVRDGTPLHQRLEALKSVLGAVIRKDLIVDYYFADRDVEDDWSLRVVMDDGNNLGDYVLAKKSRRVATFTLRERSATRPGGGS